MLKAENFFSLKGSRFADLFAATEYVWQGLPLLADYIGSGIRPNVAGMRSGSHLVEKTIVLYRGEIIRSGFEIDQSAKSIRVRANGRDLENASIIYAGAVLMDDQIEIGQGVVVEPTALIKGPAIIADNSEVRHGAYIRGEVIVGPGSVVGHATEIKSSVMLGDSKAGHFAYIGNSILGKVNLGAGTKLANLKMIEGTVKVTVAGESYDTGLRKFGAIIGDGVETGCNSVTSPGTLIGPRSLLYPNGTARGYYSADTVIKVRQRQDKLTMPQVIN